MTSKTVKTILFASLIAAMILPFSSMGIADAAPNENANDKAKNHSRVIIPEGHEMTPFGIWKSENIKNWDGVSEIDTKKIIKEWKDKNPGKKTPAEIAIEKMHKKSKKDNIPGFSDGWNLYGFQSFTSEPDDFVAYWKVPNAPSSYSSGDSIFYFNAFSSGDDVIVQPVLQYGNSAACNSASWKIASWIVVGPYAYKTSCSSASTGNTIKGEILSQGNYWTVKTKNLNTGVTKTLTANVSDQMNWAAVALETYGLPPTCSYIPNDVKFYSMKIDGSTPSSWSEITGYTWCGMDMVSSSGSTVYLNTNN